MNWIIYIDDSHPTTRFHGGVCRIMSGPENEVIQTLGIHEAYMEGEVNPFTQYINISTGLVDERQQLPLILSSNEFAADGVDFAQLSGLPVPFTLLVNDTEVLVTDGSLEISTNTVGIHRVLIDHAKFKEERLEFYAV